MRFDLLLDEVFSTWSHIAVLRVLMNSSRSLSGREIARLSHMNHRSCLRALTRLEHIAFVSRARGGRDHFFTLNREHRLWQEGIHPLLDFERRHLGRLVKRLRKELALYVESAILFGPAITKREMHGPSIDLCLVISSPITEREIRVHLDSIAPMIWKRYGATIHTMVCTETDFVRRIKRGQAQAVAILSEGQLITGKSFNDLLPASASTSK
jgi:hypothetical protein